MNDYISREAMLNNLTADLEHHSDEGDPRTVLVMQRFIKYVEGFPAADAQPMKRGSWIAENRDNRGYADCYTCTNCNCYTYTYTLMKDCEYDYCPNCGARMKQED